jgi:ribosomal protein S18 acetylase RimI-like enzyme
LPNNPKVKLRKMREDEFSAYRNYFIADYGGEISRNYDKPLEHALKLAEEDIDTSLPQGPLTPANQLTCIDLVDSSANEPEETRVLGYLWYTVQENNAAAFICDFFIHENYRGAGYGKSALSCLEKALHSLGVEEIKLRVAHDNKRALSLYETLGYKTTGTNMAKNIQA